MDIPQIEILDDAIPLDLRTQVWEYLADQTWFVRPMKSASLQKTKSETEFFIPSKDGWDYCEKFGTSKYGCSTPRTLLAVDEYYLKTKHKIIGTLWKSINQALGNKYEITGEPEGMSIDNMPEWKPRTAVPGLTAGWRVYTNGRPKEPFYNQYGIHRDNINLDEEGTFNILYCANLEWYPTWFGECVFYGDEVTGDTQQFQKEAYNQSRGFNVGYPTQIVGSVPGRLIVYDSRILHNTRPASNVSNGMRVTIAFRCRLKDF
jgi:hypothetical protein